jgi:hypothetical protein
MRKELLTNPRLAHSASLTRVSSLFLNAIIVLSMVSALMMWIVSQYQQVSLVDLISFQASDQSWVPDGSLQQPAVGVHFFGDYVLGRAWSIHPDPYNLVMPAYPPISLLLFKPFALMPYQVGLVTYFSVSIALFTSAIYAWLSHLPTYVRLMAAGLLAVFAHPSLVALDRGNQIYMMFGLVAWGFVLWKRGHFTSSGIAFGLAMGIKIYLFPVLLPFLLLGARKIALSALLTGLGLTAMLWQTYPGGLAYNVSKFLAYAFSPENAAGSGTTFFQIQQNTISSGLLQVASFFNNSDTPFDFYESTSIYRSLPLALWLLVVCLVSLQRNMPLVVRLSLAFSISQHISSNGSYSTLWLVIAAMLLLTSDLHFMPRSSSKIEIKESRLQDSLLVGLGVVVLLNLVITPLSFNVRFNPEAFLQIPVFYTYGAVSLLVFEIYAVLISLIMFFRQIQERNVV